MIAAAQIMSNWEPMIHLWRQLYLSCIDACAAFDSGASANQPFDFTNAESIAFPLVTTQSCSARHHIASFPVGSEDTLPWKGMAFGSACSGGLIEKRRPLSDSDWIDCMRSPLLMVSVGDNGASPASEGICISARRVGKRLELLDAMAAKGFDWKDWAWRSKPAVISSFTMAFMCSS